MDSQPLHPDDPLLDFASETPDAPIRERESFVIRMPRFVDVPHSMVATRTRRGPQRTGAWLVATIAACVGTLTGYAAGYVIAPIRIIVPPVTPAHLAAATGNAPTQRAERSTDAAPRPSGVRPVRTSGRGRPTVPAATNHRGAVEVLSRPPGALVFLNGNAVGRAPLSIVDVPEGTHEVRLELAGFTPRVTSVRVTPGNRARVRGSLEP